MSHTRTNMPGAYLKVQRTARRVKGGRPEITGYRAINWFSARNKIANEGMNNVLHAIYKHCCKAYEL